ncbi:YcaO-like family protein [Nesterenkonia cremea]|uniref:YcaO domain-containing protein n=1 Tax=Nesterenkonia cremea TaxID=1882340 RepID=A0A917ER69_9MICC|nr:YcaO-like family protein [Nesterenkonia cremea]GGE78596.1 hypothetical protein GCM10011401_27340 [Nesterenkonia cremea]
MTTTVTNTTSPPPTAGPVAPPSSVEDLIDPVTGIIRRVREVLPQPRAPKSYVSLTAEVADARRLGEWPADRVSLGTTFDDPQGAWIAAVGEAVERYCGNFIPRQPHPEFREGTHTQLSSEGLPLIDLKNLPQYAEWQTAAPDFPYAGLDADTPTLWTRCDDGTWLPSSLIHLNWRQSGFRHLPRTHHLNYAGIATGQDHADARRRGLLELVERHALETWWHLDLPTAGVDLASVPGLLDQLAGCDLDCSLVVMPNEFAPAMAALVRDPVTGIHAAGFSAKLDPADAARKAVLEAVHTWVYSQGCVDADGWVFQAVQAGLMAEGLYLRHRQDRRYLDDVGPRFSRVRDLGAHVQVWLDPRVHHLAARFTDPAYGTQRLDQLQSSRWVSELGAGMGRCGGAATQNDVETVDARLAARGHRVLTKDLTTDDIAETPLRVVRTFVTGLVPNAPAAFGYFGCEALGGGLLAPEQLTLTPPPHM